ncbi:MAG TPA: tRNA uridine-5-carboxymethylaminomethyl(34) synthesis GTPase MnmE, partial [Firmicutes bacterium]|nr:tRNA uridine-5-carboxymethylaminomethyl(34) synthesis GTPase MnmE [Bacillota bacterium]
GAKIRSISALTGEGIPALKAEIRQAIMGTGGSDEQPVLVTRIRHQEALKEALGLLDLVAQGLEEQLSEDLLAVNLRASLEALGRITGRSVSDEIIKEIFSQFCIGK